MSLVSSQWGVVVRKFLLTTDELRQLSLEFPDLAEILNMSQVELDSYLNIVGSEILELEVKIVEKQ